MTLNIETTKLSVPCLLNQKSWKTKLPRKIRREKLKIWTQVIKPKLKRLVGDATKQSS